MKRVFVLVLDSLGIGYSKDSVKFGDYGSNTLGHIIECCYKNFANSYGRNGVLKIPNLVKLGIINALKKSSKNKIFGFNKESKIIGSYAYSKEISTSKDTSSGHWEMMGSPVLFKWTYFKSLKNSFPLDLLNKIQKKFLINGFLGNCHASGTDIINIYGKEHIKYNYPIIYTSSDSVFQIACHEKSFGLERLYDLCLLVRKILNKSKYKVTRVIARPFLNDQKNQFYRTRNRKDFSISPNEETVLEKLVKEKKGEVISIGKISDIFNNKGITKQVNVYELEKIFEALYKELKNYSEYRKKNIIVFANFVDFDSYWGHRRDVSGYAKELELFDIKIPKFLSLMKKNDLLIITSDHGCDPTWKGTDHTREHVPILIYKKNLIPKYLGYRKTFSDISQTISNYLGLSKMKFGKKIIF
ncbi:phosphopentomutase [Buchnera aphidicola]|uniref:phosphopentomutase n=1 Tax=Buchnera aphidicola TaxID=9 RepID=UPI0030EC5F0D